MVGALRIVGKALLWLVALVLLLLVLFRIAAEIRETDRDVPPGSRLIPTSLGAVAVHESGPAAAPPILLVHGTAGWSGFWRNVSAHLAGRGWRVIAVDLPPFGYSERDPQARYDRSAQAARLAEVLEQAADAPAVVVGHSFGGGPAAELALRTPARVRSLVLVDAALGELDPPPGRTAAQRILGIPGIAQPVTSAAMTNPMLTGQLLRSMLARKETARPWVETIRTPMRRKGTTEAYAAWLPNLFLADDGAISRRSAALAAIAVPVALIWGEADTVTPIAQGERLERLMRARSFARLPGVGHIPHIEDEAAFLAALDAALAADRGEGGR